MTVWRHSNTNPSLPSYRFQSSASSLSSSPSPPVSSSASRSPSLSSGNSGGAHHAHQPFPAPLFAGNARRDAHEENFDDNGLSNNFASDSESGIRSELSANSVANSTASDFTSNTDSTGTGDDIEDSEVPQVAIDDVAGEIFLYAGSDVTVYQFAELFSALQSTNSASLLGMDRVYAAVTALLPKCEDHETIPSPSVLRSMVQRNLPKVRRIHAFSQDCVQV